MAKQYSKNIFTFLLCLLYLSFTNLAFINYSHAAKIDATDPFDMYDGECGCENLATKQATLSCLKAQLSCGVLFDIPTCKITDSLKERIKNDEITEDDIKDNSNVPNNFKTGNKIVDEFANTISKAAKGAQTTIKGFDIAIKILQNIGKIVKNANKIITLWDVDSKPALCTLSLEFNRKNFFEGVSLGLEWIEDIKEDINRYKACLNGYIIKIDEISYEFYDLIKALSKVFVSTIDLLKELLVRGGGESAHIFDNWNVGWLDDDTISKGRESRDNRYYDPKTELSTLKETRKLRKTRKKLERIHNDYVNEEFFRLKDATLFNANMHESLSYGFLYVTSRDATHNDPKTINKKLQKVTSRGRILNACNTLRGTGDNKGNSTASSVSNISQGTNLDKLDILSAKKCTFYLNKKYKEIDKKVQQLQTNTKALTQIINKQIKTQEKIEAIINNNKKSIVKLRHQCEQNVETYFKNIGKLQKRNEDIKTRTYTKIGNISNDDEKVKKVAAANTQLEKTIEKINPASKQFIKSLDKLIKKILPIIKTHTKSIIKIEQISAKYFDNRLGRYRYKHIKSDIKKLRSIRSSYTGSRLCYYLNDVNVNDVNVTLNFIKKVDLKETFEENYTSNIMKCKEIDIE